VFLFPLCDPFSSCSNFRLLTSLDGAFLKVKNSLENTFCPKMSFNSTSPTNYGFEGDPLLEAYMNAKFSEEISEKMKVPKRIGFQNNQEMEIENEILNGNQMNSWNYYDKLDMTVPDRIVIIEQDQHLGELHFLFPLLEFHLCPSYT
jgi:Mitochondrial and peroxisomal fission factor Mff